MEITSRRDHPECRSIRLDRFRKPCWPSDILGPDNRQSLPYRAVVATTGLAGVSNRVDTALSNMLPFFGEKKDLTIAGRNHVGNPSRGCSVSEWLVGGVLAHF